MYYAVRWSILWTAPIYALVTIWHVENCQKDIWYVLTEPVMKYLDLKFNAWS